MGAPVLSSKLRTLSTAYGSRGLAGVAQAVYFKPGCPRLLRWGCGKFIQRFGNEIRVDGCRFSLDTPAIPLRQRVTLHAPSHEGNEREAAKRHVNTRLPLLELGGFIGVVACVTNRLLDDPTAHAVLEANPAVLDVLEANRRRNGCGFRVIHGALSYGGAEAEFFVGDDAMTGNVQGGTRGSVRVPAMTLAGLLGSLGFERCSLICDIEGAETELVMREAHVIRDHVETFIVEFHPDFTGEGAVRDATERLRSVGFREVERSHATYVFVNQAVSSSRRAV
jgi:FkbM family methyltransferase